MTPNQNPVIPPPTMAIEIDRFIYECQLMLSTHLTWMSNPYGRVFRFREQAGKKLYYPEVYKGNNNYLNVQADNDKTGQCYFIAWKEKNTFNSNLLTYEVSVVFQVNLDLIDKNLKNNELFTQNLIAQSRQILTTYGISNTSALSLTINDIHRDQREVYKEFYFEEEYNKFNRSPLQCWRVNMVVELAPECDFNFDFKQALLNNITQDELLNVLLPTIDFSNPLAISALTAQQVIDLKNAL